MGLSEIIDIIKRIAIHIFKNKGSLFQIICYFIIFISIYSFQLIKDQYALITKNWHKYRCQPYIIPVAGLFAGDDFITGTAVNFKYCMRHISIRFLSMLFEPFRKMMKMITTFIADFIFNLNQMRKMASILREMFRRMIEQVMERLVNSVAAIQFYQEKFRNLLKKQYAIFQLIYYYMETLRMTFKSFIGGPMPVFLLFLMIFGFLTAFILAMCLLCPFPFIWIVTCPICLICFKPGTLVQIDETGRERTMESLELGSSIYPQQRVIGKMKFLIPNKTGRVYNVNGTWATGSHMIFTNNTNKAKRVSDSYTEYDDVDELVCITTTKHKIYNRSGVFADYAEQEGDIEFDAEWNTRILRDLNGVESISGEITNYKLAYPTGFIQKPILHDLCECTGFIEHLIVENGVELYEYDGIIMSGNNLVYVESTKLWMRVCDITSAKPYNGPHQNVLYHITTKSGIFVYNGKKYRDFMETSNESTYEWFHTVSLYKINNMPHTKN